jgi:hypothetical protein
MNIDVSLVNYTALYVVRLNRSDTTGISCEERNVADVIFELIN